jgi:APA family basic amino acid/polyamine antiporter
MISNGVEGSKVGVGSLQLFSLAIGAILGAGWIIGVGQWIVAAGPLGSIIGFCGGAIVLSLIAACYAELGTLYPRTGGEVVYAGELLGVRIAYFTGWFLAITYVAVCAFSTISIGWIVEALAPGFTGPILYSVLGEPTHLTGLLAGICALAAVTYINVRGVGLTTRVQDLLLAAMLLASLVFIAAALSAGRVQYMFPLFATDVKARAWPGVLRVFVTAPFWLSGFAVVSQALEERANITHRRMLIAVFLAAINLACLFYCLVIVATASVLPREQLLQLSLPAAGAFMYALHSMLLGKLVLLTGLLGLLIALNSVLFSAIRVVYSMGRGRLIPEVFGRTGRTCPPVATGFVVSACLLGTILGRGAIAPLVDATSIVLAGIYLMVCVATWRITRRTVKEALGATRSIRLLLPIVATAATLGLAIVALITPWRESRQILPPQILLLILAALLGEALRLWQRCGRTKMDASNERGRQ